MTLCGYSSQPNLDWCQQAKALIEPVNSMGGFGKLLHNRLLGHLLLVLNWPATWYSPTLE